MSHNLRLHKAYRELDEIVRKHKPDILCLQEYKSKDHDDIHNLQFLAFSKIGLVSNAIYYNADKFKAYDNVKSLPLPRPVYEMFGIRRTFRLQLAVFKDQSSGKEFLLANVHLSHLLATNIARRKQMTGLLELINEHRGTIPAIIVGDFNYPRPDNHLRAIAARYDFKECGANNKYRTHKSKFIKGKLDRAFVSLGIRELSTGILDAKASDHLPIIAKLHI